MLNRIILSHINNNLDNSIDSNIDNNINNNQGLLQLNAMQTDDFENPSSYKGWAYPLRYLLALKYLKIKQQTLDWFRSHKIYPVAENDFRQALIQNLSGKKRNLLRSNRTTIKKPPFTALPFKSWILYPVLIAALLFGLWSLNNWYQQRRIENVLANHLPYFSDLVHRKLILRHAGSQTALQKIDAEIDKEQQKVLLDLPEQGNIRSLMETQLELLKDSATSIKDVLLASKALNIEMDKQGIPYYLSPKSFNLPCSSFIDAPVEEMMMLKKLESLLSDDNPELCRTSMMTVYKVKQRKQLYYHGDLHDKQQGQAKVELPLFLSTRIDKVPAVDSALGLTYKETGIGSLILLDRIKRFATESLLPALTFQGRSYVIPYWMQGYYEIEESVTKSYKKDLKKIYPDKQELREVKEAVKQLLKDKNRLSNSRMQQTLQRNNSANSNSVFGSGLDAISVLLGNTRNKENKKAKTPEPVSIPLISKLDEVILPSIEYHEAYHQIDKTGWKTPAWQKTVFKDLDEKMIDHSLEELGAYLSQLANTDAGHNIWLSKLLIFSLNPMTIGQAEYYASGMILTSMKSLYQGKPIKPRYDASVEEKTEIFKVLSSLSSHEIRFLAKMAYETLFERKDPALTPY